MTDPSEVTITIEDELAFVEALRAHPGPESREARRCALRAVIARRVPIQIAPMNESDDWRTGFNACRAAVLKGPS